MFEALLKFDHLLHDLGCHTMCFHVVNCCLSIVKHRSHEDSKQVLHDMNGLEITFQSLADSVHETFKNRIQNLGAAQKLEKHLHNDGSFSVIDRLVRVDCK